MTQENLTRQEWRRLAVSAYLPTGLSMIGLGAIIPLVSLTALHLGATVAQAALVIALFGVGSLVGALPAGVIAARFGERRAMVGSCAVDACCLITCYLAPNVTVLASAVFVAGMSSAVVGLARQGYLTTMVPARFRARALSSLGGVFRIGSFIGPLAGAAVIATWNLQAAYLLATGTSICAGIVTLLLPDLPREAALAAHGDGRTSTFSILRTHARSFLTIGLGAAGLQLVRASRDSIIPLWCQTNGLHPSQTSLIYGVSSGVDMLVFYLGGSLMDRFGRRWVAMPAMVIMGTCFALLPLAHSQVAIAGVGVALGFGNGLSSGLVMTLGSDAAPRVGQSQFLAGWRLTAGLGQAAGPLLITAITTVAPIAAASLVVAAFGWAGGAWLWRWTPRPAAPAASDQEVASDQEEGDEADR